MSETNKAKELKEKYPQIEVIKEEIKSIDIEKNTKKTVRCKFNLNNNIHIVPFYLQKGVDFFYILLYNFNRGMTYELF